MSEHHHNHEDYFNPKDAEARRKAELENKKFALEMEAQTRAVMGTAEGRKFILDLIFVKCGALQTTYVQKDSLASAFNEGKRTAGLEILAQVEQFAPDLHLLARREEIERKQKEQPTSAKQIQEKTNG